MKVIPHPGCLHAVCAQNYRSYEKEDLQVMVLLTKRNGVHINVILTNHHDMA